MKDFEVPITKGWGRKRQERYGDDDEITAISPEALRTIQRMRLRSALMSEGQVVSTTARQDEISEPMDTSYHLPERVAA